MGQVKGAKEFRNFKANKRLTRKEAMLAKCYECNGEEEGTIDCQVPSCPMYPYHWYRKRS